MTTDWTPERWAAIEDAFHAACAQPAASREQFVRTTWAADTELVAEVLGLLAADAATEVDLLEQTAAVLIARDPLVRARFGPFELVERIAEGGMGTVYRGHRVGADFAQQAAVKVLRLGLAAAVMREQFARERRLLASLVHPNVARLLDGGTNDDGVPFIAMELIDGVAIDRYADANRLPIRARLGLFVQVCRAVQFAHRNLVVHLDLKPSNILVDVHGAPKLLDFGVAGLLGDVSTAGAGTPRLPATADYASPELLCGEPVGTAADVYSLGVVLHEMLVGLRPRRDGAALAPPSRRVDEASAAGSPRERASRRGLGTAQLVRVLRSDLDHIVRKALEPEADARYPSCEALADDIERYLRGLPVLAREPTLGYRARRFVARHFLAVGAAAGLALALSGGLWATLEMARVARHERDEARAARRQADRDKEHARIEAGSSAMVAAMLSDTFLSAEFIDDPLRMDRARAALTMRAGQARRRLDHPRDAHELANVLDALGRALAAIDAFDDAEPLMREALALRVATFGADSLEHALSLTSLGRLRYQQGRFEEALPLLEESYRLHKTCPPGVHTDVAVAANDLAATERACGHRERPRQLHEEALRLRRKDGEPDSLAVAESLNNLANVVDDPARSADLLREALAIRERLLGPGDTMTLQTRINLARLCINRARLDEARSLLVPTIATLRETGALGSEPLVVALTSLAYADMRLGDMDAARTALDEAIELQQARAGGTTPALAIALDLRARTSSARGDQAAAIRDWREALRIHRLLRPPHHRDVANALVSLADALTTSGAAAEALPLLTEAADSHAAADPARALDLADTRVALSRALEQLLRFDEAAEALAAALAAYEADPSRRDRLPALTDNLTWLRARARAPSGSVR